MFDGTGKIVVDGNETIMKFDGKEKSMADQAPQIANLRKELAGLSPSQELLGSEKDRVLAAVKPIVDPSQKAADRFERRKLEIEQENTDCVIVKKGLKVGDRVVSNGSLILSQMYEDQNTVDSGLPVP
jgi:hypothetical protein